MQSKQQLALTYLEQEPSAAAKILESVTEAAVAELLSIAPISTAAQVFEQLSTGKGIACLDAMDQQTAAHLLTQLSAMNAATLLKGLPQTKRKALYGFLGGYINSSIRSLSKLFPRHFILYTNSNNAK
ncbi:magnesium transporter MgtE N-terminal domain-containing protein [Zooshikella ganghwensis]|uniref:Magnesium transporter MgtE intracellular domain-containing protein n=1 Tax=Zooshikella ganghwensis TaxID=202772 RepID=A0A4V1INM6_9GAMM|nr:hypothetical protein B9G39_12835 [Zooshikella ganghwensis]